MIFSFHFGNRDTAGQYGSALIRYIPVDRIISGTFHLMNKGFYQLAWNVVDSNSDFFRFRNLIVDLRFRIKRIWIVPKKCKISWLCFGSRGNGPKNLVTEEIVCRLKRVCLIARRVALGTKTGSPFCCCVNSIFCSANHIRAYVDKTVQDSDLLEHVESLTHFSNKVNKKLLLIEKDVRLFFSSSPVQESNNRWASFHLGGESEAPNFHG